jgi:phasin family protein
MELDMERFVRAHPHPDSIFTKFRDSAGCLAADVLLQTMCCPDPGSREALASTERPMEGARMIENAKLQPREDQHAPARRMTAEEQPKVTQPKTSPPSPNGSSAGFGFVMEEDQQAFARWFRGVSSLSAALAEFIQSRLQDDMAAWSALASCTTSGEALECQRRFAEKATAQYSQEITKLSQLMLRLATEGLQSFERKADNGS